MPATEEIDEEAVERNREFTRLSNSVPAFEYAIDRARDELDSAVQRATPERFTGATPAKLVVLVTKYVFDLGNETWGRAGAAGSFGISMGTIPESDRIARLKARVALVDPVSGENLIAPQAGESTYRKYELVVPDVDDLNDDLVQDLLDAFIQRNGGKAAAGS